MANLDTREKRSSGIMISLPWRGLSPLSDGSVDQTDRQHILYMYSGISFSDILVSKILNIILVKGQSETILIKGQSEIILIKGQPETILVKFNDNAVIIH